MCCRRCWSTATWPACGARSPGGIEATAFHRLPAEAWEGLAAEAGALLAFLADREPTVYQRYAHWWDKSMPGAEVRVLTGQPSRKAARRRASVAS